ncbi:hypothetical protein ALC56_05533, partial [Trachymyrmex septentrionalis]
NGRCFNRTPLSTSSLECKWIEFYDLSENIPLNMSVHSWFPLDGCPAHYGRGSRCDSGFVIMSFCNFRSQYLLNEAFAKKIAERCEIIYRVEQALVIDPGLSGGERRQVISKVHDCLDTLYERQQSDRYECLYSVPKREDSLHAHRVWQASSATSRSPPFRLLGKWQIRERQTISPPFVSKELTFESIHTPKDPRSPPRRAPLTRDNTAPTKEPDPRLLRYYTRTRIIQGQI